MVRLIAGLCGGALSLALAGFSAQDPPEPPEPPQPPDAPIVVEGHPLLEESTGRQVEVRVIEQNPESRAVSALTESYDLLLRLRREGLEGRPEEMLEKAVALYKEAVENFDPEDAEKLKVSAARATAALEIARAVDRLADVRRGDNPDPELPPPPRRIQLEVKTVDIRGPEGGDVFQALPPLLQGEEGGRSALARIVVGRPGGEGDGQASVFVLKPEDLGGLARIEVQVDEKRIQELTETLQKQAEQLANVYRNRAGEMAGKIRWFEQRGDVTTTARLDLESAYKAIQKARESYRGNDDAKFYIDSARDLYNAARRDAEAGRDERASELARAAEALTKVPGHLADKNEEAADEEAAPSEDHEDDAETGDRPRAEIRLEREMQRRASALANRAEKQAAEMEKRTEKLAAEIERRAAKLAAELERKAEKQAAEAEEHAAEAEKQAAEAEKDAEMEAAEAEKQAAEVEKQAEMEAAEAEKQAAEAEKQAEMEAAEEEKQAGEDAAEARQVAGLGLQLRFTDGEVVILDLVEGSPAAEDGRIHPGDVLVGILKDDERIEFAGMEPRAIVELVRGEPGSKVTVIVRPEDEEDEQEYEIERALITIPNPTAEEPEEASPLSELLEKFREGVEGEQAPDAPLPPELP